LVIPYFSGAAFVYEHYVRPFFINPQTVNIWYVPRKKDKPDDILTAAEKYIAENGTEQFQHIINKVFSSAIIVKENSIFIHAFEIILVNDANACVFVPAISANND
jgi:aromatic ring hydroxylase